MSREGRGHGGSQTLEESLPLPQETGHNCQRCYLPPTTPRLGMRPCPTGGRSRQSKRLGRERLRGRVGDGSVSSLSQCIPPSLAILCPIWGLLSSHPGALPVLGQRGWAQALLEGPGRSGEGLPSYPLFPQLGPKIWLGVGAEAP